MVALRKLDGDAEQKRVQDISYGIIYGKVITALFNIGNHQEIEDFESSWPIQAVLNTPGNASEPAKMDAICSPDMKNVT